MSICAPAKYNSKLKSCFADEEVILLAKAYNKYISVNNLSIKRIGKLSYDPIDVNSDRKTILKELYKRFESVCNNDEMCISKQAFMDQLVDGVYDEITNKTFRPDGPTKATEWLSTTDINNIMKQYENMYSDFSFLGAVPLDCDELKYCSLFKIKYDELKLNGKKKLGVIFNHDKHYEPGSHWVALYIDTNGKIYYADSAGKKPIDNIVKIIDDFKNYSNKSLNKSPIYKYNNIRYQRDNSECGVYSCNFIIRMLAGETFEEIISNPLDFKSINSCRNIYFNNRPSKHNPDDRCDPN